MKKNIFAVLFPTITTFRFHQKKHGSEAAGKIINFRVSICVKSSVCGRRACSCLLSAPRYRTQYLPGKNCWNTFAIRQNADITIGNIVGSNIFNILFVIGISAIITPIPFSVNFIFDSIIAAASALLLLLCCIKKHRLNYIAGIIMLISYIIYFIAIL